VTEVSYYRWASLLPLVLPLAAYLALWHSKTPEGWVDKITGIVVVSGMVGTPVYLPFMFGVFWWLRRRPVATYRTVSLITPLLFAAAYMLSLLAFTAVMGSDEPKIVVLLFLPYLLAIGYGYVGLVHALRVVLSVTGVLQDANAQHAV
jgi:hypothetical protein